MSEESWPWPGTTVGDAGPYSDDDWDNMWETLYGSGVAPYNNKGVIRNWLNELAVTSPGVNAANVATGAALVHGKFYRNTAVVNVVGIPSAPGGAGHTWREDLICVRSSWVAQTIRVYRHANPADEVAYPAPTQTDGTCWEIPLAAVRINAAGTITLITDLREFAYNLMHVAPCARVYRDAVQSINNSSWVYLSFNAVRFDNDGMWNVANPTRLTCQKAGIYQISLTILWDSNNVGGRIARINESVGGLGIAEEFEDAAAVGPCMVLSTLYKLNQGDYVTAAVFQTSGGPLNILSSAKYSPEFMMVKVA